MQVQGLWPIAGQGSFVLANRTAIILAPAYRIFRIFTVYWWQRSQVRRAATFLQSLRQWAYEEV